MTHPDIAKRIVEAYGLPDEFAEELIPRNYRKDGEEYDPERYRRMENVDGKNAFRITHKDMKEVDIYIAEHQKEMKRKHMKRGAY